MHVSPLGILIHPEFGLWHAYRGAMAFGERLALPPREQRASPCASCATRPCETACPVGAIAAARSYDATACTAHVASALGRDCRELGCRARRTCPVGAEYGYGPAQAEFHMSAFLRRS